MDGMDGRSRLTASGRGPRFSIAFEHPLTGILTVSLDSQKDFRASLEQVIARPEFATVARAPADVPHARLLGAIRENAKGLDWPPSVIERLAVILEVHGVLTSEEAEWLEDAGAAW